MSDLKSLRTLAEHLLSFDAVTFLAYLDNLRITEGVASIWLFHDAAHTVFEQVLLPLSGSPETAISTVGVNPNITVRPGAQETQW